MFGRKKDNAYDKYLLDSNKKTETVSKTDEKDGMFKRGAYFVTSLFGVGFAPFAPGTLASLLTIPIAWFIVLIGGARGILISSLILFIIGYIFTAFVLQYIQEEDPSFIVIDEVVGQLLTFLLPVAIFISNITPIKFNVTLQFYFFMYIGGFALFRFFDIVKPFQIGWIDKNVKGAMGIMADDVAAALFASATLTVILLIYVISISIMRG